MRILCDRFVNARSGRHARYKTAKPWAVTLSVAVILVLGVSVQAVSTQPNKGQLIGPGGSRLPIQTTDGPSGSFTPYSPGELWGGGNQVEQCQACDMKTTSGQPEGQSIQPGQSVNPLTGDFTYSQSLFDVPTTGGSMGLNLVYDSQEAGSLLGCASGFCGPTLSPWPNFGFGWRASEFPSFTMDNVGSTEFVVVQQDNGSQVEYSSLSGSYCGQGDYSDPSSYTGPALSGEASEYEFCAPYRVDAQVGVYPNVGNGYVVFYAQGGKQQEVTFSLAAGTPVSSGNIAQTGALTYDTMPATPGSCLYGSSCQLKCPTSVPATIGHEGGCWMVNDSAGRSLVIVIGNPSTSPYPQGDTPPDNNVLEVIDPGDLQPYYFRWTEPAENSSGQLYGPFDEPQSITSVNDSSIATYFSWEGIVDALSGGPVGDPNMDGMN